ncbi:unnamed protein product [Rhizophagus irregularis]|nr:unnamed protein product [Rhizophagus irregularis]
MPDELFQQEIDNLEANYTIDDFHKSNERNSVKSSKIINTFRGDSERLPNEFKMLQINSNIKGKNIDINDDEKELILRKTKRQNISNIDDDEMYNNPNLHSNEQDELEIPDDGF